MIYLPEDIRRDGSVTDHPEVMRILLYKHLSVQEVFGISLRESSSLA
jgi:hypothetical protein